MRSQRIDIHQHSASRSRQPTRHRLTRLGFQVMLIGVFGLIGGALNGLNLLVVVAAISFGALVMQWRVCRDMVELTNVERRLPAEIFAGSPARLRYQITNRHRIRPLWLIRIDDPLRRFTGATGYQMIRTGIGWLSARRTASVDADVTVMRRGRYVLGRWRASSVAPLALSTAWRDQATTMETIDVYPQLLTLQPTWRQRLPARIGSVSSNAQRQGVADDVFFGLREYRHGDSPKYIHWRTTARLGQPAVRQFEQQQRLDLCLVVDAHCFEGSHDVEIAVSLAATIAVELSGGLTALSVVAVAGESSDAVSSGASREGLRRVLRMLARTQPSPSVDLDATLEYAMELSPHRPDLMVVSTRSLSEALLHADAMADQTSIHAQPSLLRQWQRRSPITWINVADEEIHGWIASDVSDRTNHSEAPSPQPAVRPEMSVELEAVP
ncbi:MAG: DUF58 domain-containing protein [Planctomycetota bacterium]